MAQKVSSREILVEARALLAGEPLALFDVSGQPWLAYYLDVIESLNLSKTTKLLVPRGETKTFEGFGTRYGVQVIEDVGAQPCRLMIGIDNIFSPSILRKLLSQGAQDISKALICKITSKDDLLKAEDFIARDKSLVTSRYFNMPLAKKLAFLLKSTSVTPNQITVLTLLVGLLASFLAGVGSYSYDVAAAILIQVALTLDLTDGYLARISNKTSRFGEWFDTLVDSILNLAVILGVVFGTIRVYGEWWGLVGAVWLLAFHANSCRYWFTKVFNFQVGIIRKKILPSAFKKPGRGILSQLKPAGSNVLVLAHGLDSKFHIISLGLLLHIKPMLIVFMGACNLTSLSIMVYKKYIEERK